MSIPEEDFLGIETTRGGEEFFIAFATEERLDEAALLEIREELRGEVAEAQQAGAGPDAIARRIAALIARKFPGSQNIHHYTVQ